MIDPRELHGYFDLHPAELSQLAAAFSDLSLATGQDFLRQGEYHPRMAFVRSGYLRVHTETNGKEVTQWIAPPRYLLTDLAALVYGEPARWTITALTDCRLSVISASDYARLGKEIPGWPRAERSFLAHCFVTLENRVLSFLSLSARQRYEALFTEHPDLFNRVPLQYLASMLGMTPETLSRIRAGQRS
ncbi:CRP-like cAMP-binding protein [Neolewinella xylanilytica]|uniref:CRP-like cAMP-binding protein n=1 Tax=Neolewinella xylanilytica TaxID=1514080 RepID=A0A2S6I6R5_9BACT|nr:Crp/Fnr family transcriptional regulator [Neolewinella xylanilytica]PPK87212.1 CRP-like cAMP-binding protein [Neolewinella xylanilytica]